MGVTSTTDIDDSGETGESVSTFIAVAKPAGLLSLAHAALGPIPPNFTTNLTSSMIIELCYVDAALNVTYITPGCSHFGVTLDLVQNGLRASSWITDFESFVQAMQKEDLYFYIY